MGISTPGLLCPRNEIRKPDSVWLDEGHPCPHPRVISVGDIGDGVLLRCLVCGDGRMNGAWTGGPPGWEQIRDTLKAQVPAGARPHGEPAPNLNESMAYYGSPNERSILSRKRGENVTPLLTHEPALVLLAFSTGFILGAGTIALGLSMALWFGAHYR
jgi:hypothetical protein